MSSFLAIIGTSHAPLFLGAFLLAGVVKGLMGLGLPTVSMALLGLVMAPAEAAAVIIIPTLITNVLQIRPWKTLWPLFKRVAWLQAGILIGTLGTAGVLGAPAGSWATISLGGVLLVYSVWGLFGRPFAISRETERRFGLSVGLLSGVIGGATGLFFIPAIPFLQAIGLERDELMQAMGITFTVSMISMAMGLYSNAYFHVAGMGLSVLMLLPAVGGMYLGQYLRQRLSPNLFRAFFFCGLGCLGFYMVCREMLR